MTDQDLDAHVRDLGADALADRIAGADGEALLRFAWKLADAVGQSPSIIFLTAADLIKRQEARAVIQAEVSIAIPTPYNPYTAYGSQLGTSPPIPYRITAARVKEIADSIGVVTEEPSGVESDNTYRYRLDERRAWCLTPTGTPSLLSSVQSAIARFCDGKGGK